MMKVGITFTRFVPFHGAIKNTNHIVNRLEPIMLLKYPIMLLNFSL